MKITKFEEKLSSSIYEKSHNASIQGISYRQDEYGIWEVVVTVENTDTRDVIQVVSTLGSSISHNVETKYSNARTSDFKSKVESVSDEVVKSLGKKIMNAKTIAGFDSRYTITTDGKVLDTTKNRYLKQGTVTGSPIVSLREGDKISQYRVSRLVAQTFIPNPDKCFNVGHRDGDTMNVDVSNLFWTNHRNTKVYDRGYISDRSTFLNEDNTHTKAGRLWHSVMARCYSGHEQFYSYKDCEVAESWWNFNNFDADIKTLVGYDKWLNGDERMYELDKDILGKGRRIYSKETCMFTLKEENSREAALRRWDVDPSEYKKAAVGQVFENDYGKYTILEVNNSKDVVIQFHNTGHITSYPSWEVRNGKVIDSTVEYSPKALIQLGKTYDTYASGPAQVIEIISPEEVKVLFLNSGIIKTYTSKVILSGQIGDGTSQKGAVSLGMEFHNKYNQLFTVTGYNNATDVEITFKDSGYVTKTRTQCCVNGNVNDRSELGKEFVAFLREETKQDKRDLVNLNKIDTSTNKPIFKSKREQMVDEFVGKTFATNLSGNIKVLEYVSAKEIVVQFLNTGNIKSFQANAIRNGNVRDTLSKG